MERLDMRVMVSEFQAKVTAIQLYLRNISDIIAEGRTPSEDVTSALNCDIAALGELYDQIYALARTVATETELPPKGCSIDVCAQLYHNSKLKQLETQVGNLQKLLEKFVAVESTDEEYKLALTPFQEEASRGLQQLTELNPSSAQQMPPDIEAVAQRCGLFVSALELISLDSPEGSALLIKVTEEFSTKVQLGLIWRKYFWSHFDPQKPGKPAASPDRAPVDAQEVDAQENIVEKPVEKRVGSVINPTTKLKNPTPSASSFKKEIIKMPREIRIILPMFTNLGVLTADQIYRFFCLFIENTHTENLPTDLFGHILNVLMKDCIAAYTVDERGTLAYCLTEYCNACMRKESIAKMKEFWLMSYGKFQFTGIMARKRELATFESIGMSKRQMRSMLRSEGVGYAAITIFCSLTLGNLLTYGLFLLLKNVLEYTRFSYPFIPVLAMYIIILLICCCTPAFIYRGISQATLVERLREVE